MDKHPHVCVIGSINMDLVTTTKKMPAQGETILGDTFETFPGGKGANQAIAAARVGANVSMIGAVGDDTFGNKLMAHFEAEGIGVEGIEKISNISTGIATIILSENDNRIIVTPCANNEVTPELVEKSRDVILASDIILLQLEIPMETILYAVELAHEHEIPVILNPAPFQTIPEDVLLKATYLTPNEVEYTSLTSTLLPESIYDKMIVTKGSKGIEFSSSGEVRSIPAYKVDVKDTTGAGDTFNGVLAAGLAKNMEINEAIHFANAAAALSVGAFGAQGGMPNEEEVCTFMKSQVKN